MKQSAQTIAETPLTDPDKTLRRSALGRGGSLIGMAFLVTIVAAVYYPAATGPFVFDDAGTIVDNPSIRQLWPLVGDGEHAGPLNPSPTSAVHGRPLVSLTFAANYYLGGLDPFGYRIVNLVVHLLSALLLWAIVARTLQLDFFRKRFERVANPLAFAAALLWALHPLNTECVIYVTQRTELMMGMFYLATLYGSIRYWEADGAMARAGWLCPTVLACLAGMLSKEMMASVPAMVLLYERTFITSSFRRAFKQSWPLYLALTLTWLPLIALNLNGPRTPASGFGLGVAAHHWWLTQTKVLFLYLKLAIWPWPLVIHYQIPYLTTLADAWPWLLAVALLAAGILVLFWRQSSAAFVAIWVIAVLSPTLLIPLVSEIAAERRMYVPLAAIVPFLIVGGYAVFQHAWQSLTKHENLRAPLVAFSLAVIALAVGFARVSSHRLSAYRSELALWQDAVVHQPRDPMVQFNLGTLLAEAGQQEEAIVHLEQAVQLDPESYQACYNLARALEDTDHTRAATERYRAALQLRPEDAASHYNLARLLEQAGDVKQATKHYRQAVAAQPDFPAAHTNLGILLLNSGRTHGAIENFEAALNTQEDSGNCINLAMAYAMANRRADALSMAEKAVELARNPSEASLARQALGYLQNQRPRRQP